MRYAIVAAARTWRRSPPQRGRDLRHHAEPALERGARLVEQQPEAVDGDVAAHARRRQQRRFGRDVDEVADERALRQAIERDLERRLAGHAEARRVGEQRDAVERVRALFPRHDLHHRADDIGDFLRLVERAVGEANLLRALRREARDDGARRAAGAQHRRSGRCPGRHCGVDVAQALDEAVAVVVEAGERAVLLARRRC